MGVVSREVGVVSREVGVVSREVGVVSREVEEKEWGKGDVVTRRVAFNCGCRKMNPALSKTPSISSASRTISAIA